MKRLLLILLVIVLAFGVGITVFQLNKQPEAAPAAETAAPADAPRDAAPAQTSAPVEIRTVDFDAIGALHGDDEVVFRLGDETVTWKEYCEWLRMTGQQIEDYFSQMASYYGVAASWDGSVGDGSGKNFAQYAVEDTNLNLKSLLAYRRFAAEHGVTLDEEERARLSDEGLAKLLLGENATVEQLVEQLEHEGFSVETYRRIRETSMLLDKYVLETYGERGEKLSDEQAVAYMAYKGYVSAAHILLLTMDPNTGEKLEETAVAEKRLKAEALSEELRAIEDPEKREARFLELMNEFSEDGGRTAYPGGYTYQPGVMVSEFEAAVAAQQPGEVSDPVESVYGWHVILRLPLRADSLLYSAQGTPVSGREEAATAAMNDELTAYMDANPVEAAEGVEDLDLLQYLK